MNEILFRIDEHEVKTDAGATILGAARSAGITIPTLCHHEHLEPYGACRICTVEVELNGRTSLTTACTRPAETGMVVTTGSEKVMKLRRILVEELLAHAPDAPELQALAQSCGADRDRFEKEASFCILCGLCVRYCAEIKRKNAVGFVERGAQRAINFVPKLAAAECWKCKECFPLCPTSALQAAYVLTEALSGRQLKMKE